MVEKTHARYEFKIRKDSKLYEDIEHYKKEHFQSAAHLIKSALEKYFESEGHVAQLMKQGGRR